MVRRIAPLAIALTLAACAASPPPAADKPLVIAHRGASGHLPEHTLEAYALAIDMGADYIEPDLVMTKDGVPIARHENELSDTTDVAAKYPGRKAAKTIDGRAAEGWFSEDFTLAEIRTLRAKERVAGRSRANDGKFAVPTLAEVLELANRKGAARGRVVGVYPETKHPSYFRGIGLPIEPALLRALSDAGRNRADGGVFIQSFEVGNLQALAGETQVPLVQLLGGPDERPYDQELAGAPLTYGDMATDAGLRAIARYAAGIGPFKAYIVPMDRDGRTAAPTDFVARAHAAGLKVHSYTFRSDAPFLPAAYGGDPAAEYCLFFGLGVDGVFSDFPDAALKARDELCPMR
ncbi:MAG: glycerophosphodiester phosphodiesterase [Rhodospirillaceae bacterium]|nr:glycerophosphodiester phosphodiesterase [Rhodospirillaceae bacterium]